MSDWRFWHSNTFDLAYVERVSHAAYASCDCVGAYELDDGTSVDLILDVDTDGGLHGLELLFNRRMGAATLDALQNWREENGTLVLPFMPDFSASGLAWKRLDVPHLRVHQIDVALYDGNILRGVRVETSAVALKAP